MCVDTGYRRPIGYLKLPANFPSPPEPFNPSVILLSLFRSGAVTLGSSDGGGKGDVVGGSGESGGVHHRDATNSENIHPNHKVQARHNKKERVEDNGVTKKREREGDDEKILR